MRKRFVTWFFPFSLVIGWSSSGWADPTAGGKLFESAASGNCGTCHYTTALRKVGPGLQDVTRRHSEDWLLSWLKDPQGTWRSDHPETLELRKRTRKLRSRATSCMKKPMEASQLGDLVDYLGTLVSDQSPEQKD